MYRKNNHLTILFIIDSILAIIWLLSLSNSIFSIPVGSEGADFISNYSYIYGPVHFLSWFLVLLDARKINAGQPPPSKPRRSGLVSWKPYIWAILVIFIPIFAFALYVYKRKDIFVANNPEYPLKKYNKNAPKRVLITPETAQSRKD